MSAIVPEKHWLLSPPSRVQTQVSKQATSFLNTVVDLHGNSDDDDDPYSAFFDSDESEDDYYFASVPAATAPAEEKPVVPLNTFRYALSWLPLDFVKRELHDMKGKGFGINDQIDGKWNALMLACYLGRPDVVEFLIAEGADPTKSTAKSNAEEARRLDDVQSAAVMNQLQSAINDSHATKFEWIPYFSSIYQLFAQSSKMENAIVSVNTADKQREDVLAIANVLLNGGADLNLPEKEQFATPLHLAVKNRAIDLMEWMLRNGADINVSDSNKCTPLMWAAARGYGPIVKTLLVHKADATAINDSGTMAYEMAAFGGFRKVAKSIWLYQSGRVESLDDLKDLDKFESPCLAVCEYSDSLKEIHVMLEEARQQKHLPKFAERNTNLHEFLTMDNIDLTAFGVDELHDRMKILDVIRKVHISDWKPASIPKYSLNSTIKATDVLNGFETVQFKTNVMRCTIKYLNACARVPKYQHSVISPGLGTLNAEPTSEQKKHQNFRNSVKQEAQTIERFLNYCDKLQKTLDELERTTESFFENINIAQQTMDLKIGDLIR